MDLITPIRDQLEENMHFHCMTFCLIGTPLETPRYYNKGGVDFENNKLTIQSTQRSSLYFTVDIPEGTAAFYCEPDVFWQQFKEFRTQFLLDHYPTIDPY